MAGEEDVELRDLVAQSLEAKGVLGKIRAQLRANVFLALEEQESQESPHPFISNKLKDFQKTREGKLSLALVREFLEFFQLEFTTAVFDPETNAHESYPGREQLSRDLGIEHDVSLDIPLLSSLLKRPTPSTLTTPSTFNPFLSISTHNTTHPLSHSTPHHTHSSPHPGHIGPFTTFPTSTIPPHHSHHSPPHTPLSSERNASHTAAVAIAKPAPSQLATDSALPMNVSNSNSNSNLSHSEPAAPPLVTTAHNVTVSTTTTTSAASSLRPDREREIAKLEKRALSSDKPHNSSTQAPALPAPAEMAERSGEVSLETEDKWGGTQRSEIPKTTSRNELDNFFSIHTLPAQLPPLHLPPLSSAAEQKLNEKKTEETKSDSSVSEHLDEEDSIGSGKTTDVTQTESSLRGDYDFKMTILPQDQ